MSTRSKSLTEKRDRQPAKVGRQVKELVFSDGMGELVASYFGVPTKRKEGFKLAYRLLPLNQAKDCIDMAYYLARDGLPVADIQPWLERYETLAKTEMPKWAKKKSRDYLVQAYRALDRESKPRLTYILYEFKGFIYAVFCRTLMEQYDHRGKAIAEGS